jgi:queuosine precursor transporter
MLIRLGDSPFGKFKLLGIIAALNITFQLISDVTAGKIILLFGFGVSITVLYFPFTYIISDILTEVYGYARARAVLWLTLICSILAGLVYQLVAAWPPAPFFQGNDAYVSVFSTVPRILVGGWLAVFAGDVANNFTLAKLKIITNGRWLWLRTISSTVVGQLINTAVFYIVALYGVLPNNILLQGIIAGWIIKTIVEIAMTPVTYAVVDYLKRVEGVDHYDRNTNFNPFIVGSEEKR